MARFPGRRRKCRRDADKRAETMLTEITIKFASAAGRHKRNKEDKKMKISVYTALKNIYGTNERLNIEPVAFDYVPEKKRGARRPGKSASGR